MTGIVVSADHYRHTRLAYYRELAREGLLGAEVAPADTDAKHQPATGDD